MPSHYNDSWEMYKAHTEVFRDDLDYYLNFCCGYKALDLFAGYGRVTNFLTDNGVDIEAVELDSNFAQTINLPANKMHVSNVLDFKPARCFGRIIAAYNSFCLLTKDDDIKKFFARLDALLEPGGLVSLSYYHHDLWQNAVSYSFSYKDKEIFYEPIFDLSRAKEKIGIWIDKYKGDGIDASFKYVTRLYNDEKDLLPFLGGTDLVLVDQVKDFNKDDCIEPGWIDYVLKKQK